MTISPIFVDVEHAGVNPSSLHISALPQVQYEGFEPSQITRENEETTEDPDNVRC
jgi:hypothetical protein